MHTRHGLTRPRAARQTRRSCRGTFEFAEFKQQERTVNPKLLNHRAPRGLLAFYVGQWPRNVHVGPRHACAGASLLSIPPCLWLVLEVTRGPSRRTSYRHYKADVFVLIQLRAARAEPAGRSGQARLSYASIVSYSGMTECFVVWQGKMDPKALYFCPQGKAAFSPVRRARTPPPPIPTGQPD